MTMQIMIGALSYRIERDGRVHKRRGKGYLKTFPDKDGYLKVAVTDKDQKTHNAFVHRLVYLAYNGDIPEGMTVDHIDDDRLNNQDTNLQLLTPEGNVVKGNARHWQVVDPDGNIHQVYNLKEFCRNNGLHQGHLYTGKHKDWRLL